MEEEKRGRSWKKKKRDGPGRRKRGTVLRNEKWDGPEKSNTDLQRKKRRNFLREKIPK